MKPKAAALKPVTAKPPDRTNGQNEYGGLLAGLIR
jgi:hypothetical protein